MIFFFFVDLPGKKKIIISKNYKIGSFSAENKL